VSLTRKEAFAVKVAAVGSIGGLLFGKCHLPALEERSDGTHTIAMKYHLHTDIIFIDESTLMCYI
jgi:hypothetical protein